MNLVQLDFPTLVADTQAGKYQANPHRVERARIDPDGNIYNHVAYRRRRERPQYSNPQADDLMDKARATSDQAQRKEPLSAVAEDRRGRCAAHLYRFPIAFMLSRPNVQGMTLYRRSDHALRDGLAEIAGSGSGQRAAEGEGASRAPADY